MQLIALGRTTAVLPDSVRSRLRDDLVTVPVVDAPPVTTVIAWPAHSRSAAVAALVRTATRLRPVAAGSPRGHLRPVAATGAGVDVVGRVRDDAVRM